jgi:hypothetical protein
MNMFRTIALLSLVAVFCFGCVVPQDGVESKTSSPSATSSAAQGKAAMMVNGQAVTFAEVVKHPMMRQALNQLVTVREMYAKASEAGVKVSEEELDERIKEQQENIVNEETSWEDFLKQQSMTEDDIRQMIKTQMLFEEYMRSKMDLSEEKLRSHYAANEERINNAYIAENFLPESEKEGLGFEDVRETVENDMFQREAFQMQQEMMDEITLDSSLELDALLGDEASLYEDLILGYRQQMIRERQEEIDTASETEDGNTGEAGSDTQATGGTGDSESGAGDEEGEAGSASKVDDEETVE